ncbi:phospholipid/cholesterol/gamma-HCH transport system substrate-binding protein [Marmoricola sp. URHA0025 HA25]
MKRLVFLLPVVLLLSGCFSLNPNDHTHPGQVALGSNGYTVTAEFADMQNVVPNSTVQRDNVVIGTVTRIRVEDWTARVTMRLLKSVQLPANAEFRIGQKTLLGAQYVEVEEPDKPAGKLVGGATIPVSATGTYPETEQVLAGVSLLLNNGGLSQISTITGELDKALAGRVPDTRTLIARLNELLTTLDDHKADLLRVLDAADSLAAKVAGQSDRVERAVKALGPGLTVLASQRQRLVTAIADLGRLSTSAEKVVTTSQAGLLANLRHLDPVLKALADSGSDVANSLKILLTVPFPVNTTPNAIRGDFMNLFMTFDVSVPSLKEAFLRNGPSTPAFGTGDPLTALLLGGTSAAPSTASPPQVGPAAAPVTDGPAAAPSPTPSPAPCPLLSALLGQC